MFCTSCGSEVREGARFCPQCGMKIDRPEIVANTFVGAVRSDDGSSPAAVSGASRTGPLPPTPCPSCGRVIDGTRSTNIKCPGCGFTLHILVDPETKTRKLLDDRGKRELTKRKEELKVIHKGVRLFGQYGMTKEAIEAELVRLKQDGRAWTYRDAVWSLANKLVGDCIGRDADLHTLQMLYYAQALFLEFEGKDPNGLLELSNKMRLLDLQKHFKEVWIRSGDGCGACLATNGRSLSIEEALRTHPIPNPNCTHRFENGHYPFCRCMYEPVIECLGVNINNKAGP